MSENWEDDVSTEFGTNHDGTTLTVKRVQDVEPYLEANKASSRETPSWRKFDGGHAFHRVASIPMIVVEQWMKEGINLFDLNDNAKIAARLNSPEWAHLRTLNAKI